MHYKIQLVSPVRLKSILVTRIAVVYIHGFPFRSTLQNCHFHIYKHSKMSPIGQENGSRGMQIVDTKNEYI